MGYDAKSPIFRPVNTAFGGEGMKEDLLEVGQDVLG